MSVYRLSDAARQDLREIWDYIAQNNEPAADRMLDCLYDRFLLLAAQPRTGNLREDLDAGLRQSIVGKYVVFYRPIDDGAEVVRVLHSTRDARRLF